MSIALSLACVYILIVCESVVVREFASRTITIREKAPDFFFPGECVYCAYTAMRNRV